MIIKNPFSGPIEEYTFSVNYFYESPMPRIQMMCPWCRSYISDSLMLLYHVYLVHDAQKCLYACPFCRKRISGRKECKNMIKRHTRYSLTLNRTNASKEDSAVRKHLEQCPMYIAAIIKANPNEH